MLLLAAAIALSAQTHNPSGNRSDRPPLPFEDSDISDYLGGYCERQPARCAGRLLDQPQSVWWIQIRNSRGQVGWTNEPDKFDGKDALG